MFSEKPAGETYDDIKRCYETAEKSGRPFLTGYTRYDYLIRFSNGQPTKSCYARHKNLIWLIIICYWL